MQWKWFNSPQNEFLPDFWSWLIVYFSNFRISSALKTSSSSKSVGLVKIYSNWGKFSYLNVKTFTWNDEEKDEGRCCASRHDRAALQPIWVWGKSSQTIKTSDWCETEAHWFFMNSEEMGENKSSFLSFLFHYLYAWLVEHWDCLRKKKFILLLLAFRFYCKKSRNRPVSKTGSQWNCWW